jgi:hypothetical protein
MAKISKKRSNSMYLKRTVIAVGQGRSIPVTNMVRDCACEATIAPTARVVQLHFIDSKKSP